MFTLSDDVNPGDRTKGTVAQYKTRLNKLAQAGFDETKKLLEKPSDVIKVIHEMHVYEDKTIEKQKRLEMLTAIMYALSATDNSNSKKLEYKRAFDKNKTTYTSPAKLRASGAVPPSYRSKNEMKE